MVSLRRSLTRALSIVLCVPELLAAQESHRAFRWTVAAGSTASFMKLRVWPGRSGSEGIAGNRVGRYHVAVGAALAIPRSALNARVELLYNRLGGPEATHFSQDAAGWHQIGHSAIRDETTGIVGSLDWRAIPEWAWTPYIVTGAGYYYSRLGFSRAGDQTVREWHARSAVGINAGGGMSWRMWSYQGFAEVRWHIGTWLGSMYAPLTFGMRF